MGKLRHAIIILPDTKGLFLPINKVLKGDPTIIGLEKSIKVRASLIHLDVMVISLEYRPAHAKELIPNEYHYWVPVW